MGVRQKETQEEEMTSYFLHTHLTQLIVVAHCHRAVPQSTDIRNDSWTKPARCILVELVLVEINLVPDSEFQMLRGHGGSSIHGSAQSGRSRTLNHGLDADFSKSIRIPYEPRQGLLRAVGFSDLVNTRQDTWHSAIHRIVWCTVTDGQKGISTEDRL